MYYLDAIVSVVSSAQLIACIPQLPVQFDFFQLGFIRTAKATSEIRARIRKHPVPQTHGTGVVIGSLAQQFGLPADLLYPFVGTIVKEYKVTGKNREYNQDFTQGVVQGFEQNRAIYKPQNRSFEDFFESLESFALTKSQSGDPGVIDKSDTRSHVEKTGKAHNSPRQEQTLEHPTAQQSFFSASEAVYGQGDCKRHDLKPLQSLGSGEWKEVQGFGSWTLRVYNSVPKTDGPL